MALNKVILLVITPLFLLIAGCSNYAGDWPNLGEQLPDPEARARTVATPAPAQPIPYAASTTITAEAAMPLLDEIQQALAAASQNYQQANKTFADAEGEDKVHIWNEMQLALTRLSHTASRLDAIVQAPALSGKPLQENARKLKIAQDKFLVTERQKLSTIKP